MHRSIASYVLLLTVLFSLSPRAFADNWPRFRGPNGAGVSDQAGLPATWTDADYEWKTPLPGLGHSSPCVWGNHLFLTSAEGGGRTRHVINLDPRTGDIRWTKSITSKTHDKHEQNSFASATPATDGQRVYVLFASDEQMLLTAWDYDGNRVWQKNLGPFHQRDGQIHGSGTSPIVFNDLVIVANQQDGPSAITAFDSRTGEERWSSRRSPRLTAHSTPLVIERNGTPQLFFTNTGDGIASLDPRSGRILFRGDLMPARCVGSPCIAGDLVLATCGGGGRGKVLTAIPIDKRGDLDASSPRWTLDRNLPYVPTPVAYDGYLFLWCDNGVVVCVNQSSGEQVWVERVGGNYSGSPVCIDGKLYCISMDGEVVVMDASPSFRLHARTPLGEGSRSTPAVSAGRLFLRGYGHLFSLKAVPAG